MTTGKTFYIINQYASTPETGRAVRHYNLAKELAKRGHKVYLIAASYNHLLLTPPYLKDDYRIDDISGFKFVWIRMPRYAHSHSKIRVLNWFIFAWKILKLSKIISDKANTILYSSPSLVPFLGAYLLARKLNSKLVWDIRDLWPLTLIELGKISKLHPFILFHQWLENFACRKSDFIISNLPMVYNYLLKKGVKKSSFSWIPNGLSIDNFRKKNFLNLKTKKQLPLKKFIIGYAGSLGISNAPKPLLDAVLLTRNDKNIHYVLVGNGGLRKTIEEFILNNKLTNITLLNAIPKNEIPSLLKYFDICYAGFNKSSLYKYGTALNKLPEYFMSGKPILFSINSPYKPVNKAKAGFTVPAEDTKAIVRAIYKLKKMSLIKRRQLGKNGQDYAIKNFDYVKIAKNLEKVLI
jgi:glycosyltransferase involved in cell wall biosynthesis